MLKALLRRMAPPAFLSAYHYALALIAAGLYRWPSERMIVIGVTGTSGKSTTCYLLARALESCGAKVGMASTILFKVGEREWLNDKKMTMVGRLQLQHLLRDMVNAGCTHAIVETTSEGIRQHRHRGIHYDVCAFTNLYPEHIESHGSFEAYKAEKLKLFAKLAHDSHKVLSGKRIEKVIVADGDDPHAHEFLAFEVDRKVSVSPARETISLVLQGEHNRTNALLALHIGLALGYARADLERSLSSISSIPGRLERIEEGQPFTVIVDYAFEPRALEKLYDVVATLSHKRVIHVTGAAGGGRDRDKRPLVGALIAERADVMIVTNEDPYDEDPQKILDEVAAGAERVPLETRAEVQKILDRRTAIETALRSAHEGDIVLVTGKGSEQAIAVAGGRLIPWDDRRVVREILQTL